MTIRFLAQELYRLSRKVEDLEKALAASSEDAGSRERVRLEIELLEARKELAHYRAVLDAKKEHPKF